MKFDTIIIGGGLSGLTCGIALAQQKQRVAIINAGQSTLHFNSGSLELLGYDENGDLVDAPLKAIPLLSNMHPFHKLNAIDCLAKEAVQKPITIGFHPSASINPLGSQWTDSCKALRPKRCLGSV